MNLPLLHSPALKLLTLALILLAIVLSLYLPYRRDIKNAYSSLSSLDRQVIGTSCGPVEVAIRGQGEPVLVVHGISGGFDQGLGIAQAYLGDGYQIIVPLALWLSWYSHACRCHAAEPGRCIGLSPGCLED